MDLAERLDAGEVLAHLKQMGYRSISPEQLKEFMKDLKKLIVYDQLSSDSGSLTSLSSTLSDSEYYSTSETSSDEVKCENGLTDRPCIQQPHQFVGKHISSSWTSRSSAQKSGTSAPSVPSSQHIIGKENMPLQVSDKRKGKSGSSESLPNLKPKTSFIRPWQLQGGASGLGRIGKSDPVKLYHYYQSLWAQRKCPGEDSHSDLRWVIRERMVGQDPHLHTASYKAPTIKKTSRMRL